LRFGSEFQAAVTVPAPGLFLCCRDEALEQSDLRVDELTAAGDPDRADTWRWITAAVVQLANTTPPGPLR
jgi:hypothetical protein